MALLLDEVRAEFAHYLTDNASARFSMDKALAHVVTIAYERGLADGRRQSEATNTDSRDSASVAPLALSSSVSPSGDAPL